MGGNETDELKKREACKRPKRREFKIEDQKTRCMTKEYAHYIASFNIFCKLFSSVDWILRFTNFGNVTKETARIAVIADTHDKLPFGLVQAISEADEIWHLGDVCGEWLLDELRAGGKPLKVVRGNCDPVMEWPLTLDFTRSDHSIRMVHIPPSTPPAGVDLLLHGHTHVPRHERLGSTVFLNPGCITRPNRGAPRSYAWLTLYPEGEYRWQLRVF